MLIDKNKDESTNSHLVIKDSALGQTWNYLRISDLQQAHCHLQSRKHIYVYIIRNALSFTEYSTHLRLWNTELLEPFKQVDALVAPSSDVEVNCRGCRAIIAGRKHVLFCCWGEVAALL